MNPDNNLTTHPSPTTPESSWAMSPLDTPPQKRKSKKLMIVVILIVSVCIAAAAFFYIRRQMTPLCLTPADYATLSGESLPAEAPFDSTIDFYGFDIPFTPESGSAFADDTALAQIKALGTFYQAHASTSMNISLDAMYVVKNGVSSQTLVNQRIDTVKARLASAGIKPEMVSVHLKEYVEDPLDDAFAGADVITLSVTSSTGCRY